MDSSKAQRVPQELKEWEKEKKLIPVMIRKYCHAKHHTRGKEICPRCQELTDYALFRLERCPFKVHKKFCSFCKIHCYKPEMRNQIKEVMRWSGPRMIFVHPLYAFLHVFQMIRYKKQVKRGKKEKSDAR